MEATKRKLKPTTIPPTPNSKKKVTNYVDNERLYADFVAWYAQRKEAEEAGNPEPQPPAYLAQCIMLIPTHLANKFNFASYTYKDEMIGDAVENIVRYFRNFDINKSKNPFAYLTQITYYAFIRRIHIEKKNSYIKHKLIHSADVDEMVSMLDDEDPDFKIGFMEVLQQNSNPDLERLFEKAPKKKKGSDFDIQSLLEDDEEVTEDEE